MTNQAKTCLISFDRLESLERIEREYNDLTRQLAEARAVNKAAVAWVRSSREPMASADERMRLLEALYAVVTDADEEIDV